jgi:hypothetical protein
VKAPKGGFLSGFAEILLAAARDDLNDRQGGRKGNPPVILSRLESLERSTAAMKSFLAQRNGVLRFRGRI